MIIFAAALGTFPGQAQEWNVRFSMCGPDRVTCVVDGDTIWLQGANLRLESYDTPEPYNDICGGQAETALAKRASARLLQFLNGKAFWNQTASLINARPGLFDQPSKTKKPSSCPGITFHPLMPFGVVPSGRQRNGF